MTTDPRKEEALARRVADADGASVQKGDPLAAEPLGPQETELDTQNRRVWKISEETAVTLVPPVDEAWQLLSARLGLRSERTVRLRLLRLGGLAVAASVVIAAVLLWPARGPTIAVAGAGEQVSLTLVDGTEVELNSGSTIEYFSNSSGRARGVTLEGEAFFKVTPSSTPFVVRTAEALVTVLGTEFGVRSRHDATRVYVESGRVDVSDGTRSVELGAHQEAEREAGLPVMRVEAMVGDAQFAWTAGGIAFLRAPMAEALEELARRSGRPIVLRRADLADRTVTATFPELNLETILEAICISLECTVQFGPEVVVR